MGPSRTEDAPDDRVVGIPGYAEQGNRSSVACVLGLGLVVAAAAAVSAVLAVVR